MERCHVVASGDRSSVSPAGDGGGIGRCELQASDTPRDEAYASASGVQGFKFKDYTLEDLGYRDPSLAKGR